MALAGPGARSALPSRGARQDQLFPEAAGAPGPAAPPARLLRACESQNTRGDVQRKRFSESLNDHLSSVVSFLQSTCFVIYYITLLCSGVSLVFDFY